MIHLVGSIGKLTVFEELREIDTEALEELSRIQEERGVLEDRLARLEEEKQDVNEVVYERVKRDYRSRVGELEEKAHPLEEQARLEHGKLRSLGDGLREDLEKIGLEKEELELRHRLGELEDDDFEDRRGECEKRLEERQGELQEVEELQQRFATAFRSEEDLASPPRQDALPDGSPALAEIPGAEEDAAEEDAAEEDAAEEDAAEQGLATEEEPDEGEETGDLEDKRTTATPPVRQVPPSDAPLSESEATVLLKGPRLEIHRDDGNEELRLASEAIQIGRAVKNEVRFLSTSVSRKHARISLEDEGYVIRDLGSGNGTLVNGELVTEECPLRDGDMIQVGSEVLVFHDP